MSLCPEADIRAAMTDDEFWAHVFPQEAAYEGWDPDPEDDAYMATLPSWVSNPCPVCGSFTECGVDDEGRPLVHAVDKDYEE